MICRRRYARTKGKEGAKDLLGRVSNGNMVANFTNVVLCRKALRYRHMSRFVLSVECNDVVYRAGSWSSRHLGSTRDDEGQL